MILFAMIFGSQAVVAAPPGSDALVDEIVVLGERLKNWRAETVDGGTRCRMIQSSGDQELDAAACQVLISCGTPYRHAMETFVREQPRAGRRARRQEMQRRDVALKACFDTRFDEAVGALAERRIAAVDAR